MGERKSYHFDIGNSNEGPIGMCARVLAKTEEEAVEILRDAIGEYAEIRTGRSDIEYIHVYFNGEAIDENHIDFYDEDEVDS